MTRKSTGMLAAIMPILAFCGLTAATSCSSGSSSTPADEFTTDSIACSDSIISHGGRAYCSISVDYPETGKSALVDSVRSWIGKQLSAIGYTEPGKPAPYAAATTDLTDGSKLIKSVCSTVLADADKEIKALDSINAIDPQFGMQYEYDWNIRKIYESDTYVTYNSNTYTFMGGAHGSSANNGRTFNAETGAEIGNNMFRPDSVGHVIALVKDELMKYFEVTTPEQLREAMLINPDTLSLPSSPMTLMGDGVHFIYQQYEIAPYASGMPNGMIPFAKLKGCFTPAVEALITPAK